jgi:drug/metabolite transporter (DMT)-like permease
MRSAANHVMGRAEWLLLIGLSVLWGGSFFFAKVALREMPPLTFVLGRVGIAAVILLLAAKLGGASAREEGTPWRQFFVMGALNNVLPFALLTWALTLIPSGLGAILNAGTPLFTMLLAHVLTTDECATGNRIFGILLGLGGVALLVGLDAASGLGRHLLADLAAVGATISYACAGIYGRRFRRLPPLRVAAGQLAASTVMAAPLALALERPWTLTMPGAVTLGALFGMAVLSTALGYVVYFRLLATAGATNLLLVTFLMPISTFLLAVPLLGETVEPSQILGMALIGLGLAVIDGRPIAFLGHGRPRMGPAA